MKKKKPGLLPVSQRDLAAYLGISVTLLSMTSTGRHGTRRLGDAASLKMAALLLAHVQAQKKKASTLTRVRLQKQLTETGDRLAETMEIDARYAAAHVPLLKGRLDEMRKAYHQDREWMNTLDLLFTRLAGSDTPKADRTWLLYQQDRVLTRLQKNGLPAQVKLEVQIELKEAKGRMYSAAQKKLQKQMAK